LERLEEAIQICRAMFTQEAPTFKGKHYAIDEALDVPRPIQAGGPPILIGGGGERKTLRLVARYADGCNLFGDADMIRHKLEVLDRHCQDVGRDPAEITKTRLGTVVIGPTGEQARRKAEELRTARGISEEWARTWTVGGPDEVAEQVRKLLDAGLDGLIFNMRDAYEVEPVALAGQILSNVLG